LIDFQPASRQKIDPHHLGLIELANEKCPLEPRHALNYLNGVILNPEDRKDLESYPMIYFFYPNADTTTYDIPLRKRNAFLSKEQRVSLFVEKDQIAYRFEVLKESFDPPKPIIDDKSDLFFACQGPGYPFLALICFDHKLKMRCSLIQVTDYEADRIIIDKVEAWHKERHQEIFYTLKPIKQYESRKCL
jgi:hypothetical protein